MSAGIARATLPPFVVVTARNDTFGDETFWTDTLHMDQVVSTAVDPTTALSVGLKVDSEAQFTDANTTLHQPSDSMAEPETPSYASRSATKEYRTSPLKGVWQHPPYFHDGSAADLAAVVATYDTKRTLNLTQQEQADLVEYLKSL